MRYYILFAVIGLLSLAGSKHRVKYFPIDEIKAGQHLDQAEQKTFEEFFDRRMSPTNKKWSPCALLLTTDSFIYYGQVVKAGAGFFSKVYTDEVMTRFPLCLTVDGDSVSNSAEKFFAQKYPSGPRSYKVVYKDNGLLVRRSWPIMDPSRHTSRMLTDSILLSKTDLSIIK